MNTSRFSFLRGLGFGLSLAFSVGAVQSAFAGPGPDYWRGQKSIVPDVEPASTSPQCGMTCVDSKTVLITETRNAWANGRGPLEKVTVGMKQICESCGGTTTVMKPSLPNGRGPMRAVAVSTPHVCRVTTFARRG